jgi:tetratricopeptide (TPR) repeat protein
MKTMAAEVSGFGSALTSKKSRGARGLGSIVVFLFMVTPLFAREGVSQKEVRELLGDSYMIEQDYDRSIKQYQEILAKDPQDTKTRTLLADVLSWQKKYDQAVSEYLKVLELKPDDFEAQK